MAVAFLTITPLGTGTPSVSAYVAGVERILRQTGLKHQLTAMGTIIEGEVDEILAVVRRMQRQRFAEIREEYGFSNLESKVENLKSPLGHFFIWAWGAFTVNRGEVDRTDIMCHASIISASKPLGARSIGDRCLVRP